MSTDFANLSLKNIVHGQQHIYQLEFTLL
jgi:hypothetical protein